MDNSEAASCGIVLTEQEPETEGWFRSLVDKYGSVELENKGSVVCPFLHSSYYISQY